MLVSLNEILPAAQEQGVAVGAFNTPNLESLRAVIAAAEELNVPVIVSHAELHDAMMPIEIIGRIMVAAAREAKVPVCVHLDHGKSYGLLMRAMRLGFTSVMYDGSDLPFAQNIENTCEVVKVAKALGVTVEAELGMILRPEGGGDAKDGPTDPSVFYTDPDAAADFVAKTRIDALAIAFGTAHGIYAAKPVLDFDRIRRVREKVSLPLVMHGGSGVGEAGFRTAIRNGISKINYYTYMAAAGGEAVRQTVAASNGGHVFYHDIAQAATQGMKADVLAAMRIFSQKPERA